MFIAIVFLWSEKKRRDREEAASRTFEALAARYMIEHARRHKKTAEAYQRNLNLHILPHWRTRRFDGIGRGDVIALCEGLVAKGSPIQANRVQALISKMFSFALDAELVVANPCARLSSPLRKSRFQSEVGSAAATTTSAANTPSTTAIRPKASMASVRMTKTIALAASAASLGVPWP